MKKLFLLFISCTIVSACATSGPTDPTSAEPKPTEECACNGCGCGK